MLRKKETRTNMNSSNRSTLRQLRKSLNMFAIIAIIMTIGYIIWSGKTVELHNGSTCQPKNNIVFVKVPKCASSTITNIFQRYGDKHHLKFLLPKDGYYLGGYPEPFLILPEYRGHKYNMIVNHMIFNAKPLRDLMPKDTLYIGVVRYPVAHLKSIYNSFLLWENGLPALSQFEQNPSSYYGDAITALTKKRIWNFQSYHYRLQTTAQLNTTEIERFVRTIDSQFDFMIVADYLKESLLLLKNHLCWSMEDILFVSHKVRDCDHPNGEHNPDFEMIERNIRNWSSADFALFEHFNKTLWNKISNIDSEVFQSELAEYSKQLDIVNNVCLKYNLSTFSDDYDKVSSRNNSRGDRVPAPSKREDEGGIYINKDTSSKEDILDKNEVHPKIGAFSGKYTDSDSEFSQCAKMYLKPPLYVKHLMELDKTNT